MPGSRSKIMVPQFSNDESIRNGSIHPYHDCLCDFLDTVTSSDVEDLVKQQGAGGNVMYHLEDCEKFRSAARQGEPCPYLSKRNWRCGCSTPGSSQDQLIILGREPTAIFRQNGWGDTYHLPNCDRIVRGERPRWLDDDSEVEVVNPGRAYNSKTIAFDILRAARCDPTLPALDPRLDYFTEEVMAEHARKRRSRPRGGPTKPSKQHQKRSS